MRKIKLTREEKAIEDALLRGEFVPVSKEKFEEMAAMIKSYRKDAVLNIRINRNDLESIKKKARKLGVPYQTFIGEFLHRMAQG